MSLVIPFGQRTTVVDLPNIPFFEGCKSRYHCRLSQVRQIRALTRILTNLQSSCNPGFHGITNLKNELPRYPNSSRGSSGNPIQFWEDIKAWSKTISNLTLKKIKEKKILKTKKGKKLGSDAFQSLLFSFSLIGKSLHAPCDCYAAVASNAHLHQENIERSDDVSPEYLGFVGDMTKKIFGKGWDRKYEETCLLSVVSTNGCFEGGRKEFGALRHGKFSDHYDYVQKVLGEKDFDFQSLCRYSEVCASGKIRPLTITHSSFEVLRPLHKTLYNYISRFPWLLRGPPTPESFAGFTNLPGKFVSVDFENATDNLSVLAAERILGTLLARSTRVPKKIKECALESLRPTVVYNKSLYDWDQLLLKLGIPIQGADYMSTLNMGQMMGSLLSFPLLCLQTFFFYLYSTGQTNLSGKELKNFSGCLVNGDDLVFKTENEEGFFSAAAETCSVINKKKTHVSRGFFNINSTLFKLRRGGRVKEVPFLRPRQLNIDSCLDSGKKVREATKGLAPGSHLQKKAFSTLMKDAVDLTKKQGWSFKKAGFGGEKQMSWLRARGLLRYEANHYYHVPVESPVPREESPMQEDCMILDYSKYQVVAPLIEDLSKLYFSWSRFEKFLPLNRPKWNGEKEMRKDVIDINRKEKERLKLKKKSKRLGLNLPRFSSRFPIPINDSIFTSEKNLQKFMANRLAKKIENKNLVASRRMMDILTNNDKSLCLDPIRFHPLLLEVARKKIKKFFRAQRYIRA